MIVQALSVLFHICCLFYRRALAMCHAADTMKEHLTRLDVLQ